MSDLTDRELNAMDKRAQEALDEHLGLAAELGADIKTLIHQLHRWYLADGSSMQIESFEEIVKKRKAAAVELYNSVQRHIHQGHRPSLERIRDAHSKMTESDFKPWHGKEGHRSYFQDAGSACYICELLQLVGEIQAAADSSKAILDAVRDPEFIADVRNSLDSAKTIVGLFRERRNEEAPEATRKIVVLERFLDAISGKIASEFPKLSDK